MLEKHLLIQVDKKVLLLIEVVNLLHTTARCYYIFMDKNFVVNKPQIYNGWAAWKHPPEL